jgi:hypothetical protein
LFRRRQSLLTLIYIVIGIVVASDHHYFDHLGKFNRILSAALAIVLWPLVLLGVSLHIH